MILVSRILVTSTKLQFTQSQVYSRGQTVSVSQLQVAAPWGSVQIGLSPTDVQSSLEKATEHLLSPSPILLALGIFGAVAPLLIVRL